MPSYNDALNAEFAGVSYLFFDKIFTQGLGVKDILTSTTGFVGPGMAPLYGVTRAGQRLRRARPRPAARRLLLAAPVPDPDGFNADPDSIHRGVSMNLDVLCAKLGPPAANIPPIPPLDARADQPPAHRHADRRLRRSCHNEHDQPARLRLRALRRHGPVPRHRERRPDDRLQRQLHVRRRHEDVTGRRRADAGPGATPQTHTCYAKKLASFALQRDVVAATCRCSPR